MRHVFITYPNTAPTSGSLVITGAQAQDAEALCSAEKRKKHAEDQDYRALRSCANRAIFPNDTCAISSLIRSHMLCPHPVHSRLHKPKCKCASYLQCYKAKHVTNKQDSTAYARCQKSNFPRPHVRISSFIFCRMPCPHLLQLLLHAGRCEVPKCFATLRSQTC